MNNDISVKLSIDELKRQLAAAKKELPAGSLWKHYQGERYYIIGLTVDKNSNVLRVVYVPEDHKGLPDQVPFDCAMQEWEEQLETPVFKGVRFTKVEA